jgi:LssY C-terminus
MVKTEGDRPPWIGSAAYDIGVERSRTTGQLTHHISPNLDAERDLHVTDLTKAIPTQIRWVAGFNEELQGRNGGGRSVADGWSFGLGDFVTTNAPNARGRTPFRANSDTITARFCAIRAKRANQSVAITRSVRRNYDRIAQ